MRVVNGIVDDFVHRLGKKSDYRWPVTRKSPRCPLKAKHVRAAAHALLRGDLADGALCSDEASAVGGCKVRCESAAGLLQSTRNPVPRTMWLACIPRIRGFSPFKFESGQ